MTVSHELRTPLNAIYGWARILAAGRLKDDQKSRAIETIERNARAQTRLIDDLLDVSRVITGKLRLDVRRFRIAEVVRQGIEAVRPAFDAKRIRLETTVDPDAGMIMGDADRIQQVLWNLLSNAVKFTPEDGSVELRLTRRDAHVEILVSDTGVGISQEFLPHVFERFRQQEGGTRRSYGGLGLGLAIVRHLVELHGGTVSVTSAGLNQGSTFKVMLPVTATAQSLPRPDDPFIVPRRAVRLDGIRVLVVDDDNEARDLFASILGDAGATVRIADTADDALILLRDRPIDVLLADIEMPGKDGYQLAREALADTATRGGQLNAIAVTAYARPEDRILALEAGFQWYLTKPVEPAELVSIVASLAQSARVETRLH
jgi:CheY-like chemotaxis protein